MNTATLNDRKEFPDRISGRELEMLKVSLAERESYPRDMNGFYDRKSAEWQAMETALQHCFIGVFHHFICDGMNKEGVAIFILSAWHVEDFQLWVAEAENLTDLHAIDQGDDVRG